MKKSQKHIQKAKFNESFQNKINAVKKLEEELSSLFKKIPNVDSYYFKKIISSATKLEEEFVEMIRKEKLRNGNIWTKNLDDLQSAKNRCSKLIEDVNRYSSIIEKK